MEFLQSLIDAVLTEPVARTIYSAPFWVWMALAAALGAATFWSYWRCHVDETREEAATALRSAFGGAPMAAAADVDDPDDVADTGSPSDVAALRYRNWALETRLRRALDAAEAGEPLDVQALSEGLDDDAIVGDPMGSGEAPIEEISALKYENWRLETRLAELTAAGARAGAAAVAEGAAPAEHAELAGLESLVDSMLAAAKNGDARAFERVEAAMAERRAGADLAYADIARVGGADTLGFDPVGRGDAAALGYRNWVLAAAVRELIDTSRAGRTLDANLVETKLRAALATSPNETAQDVNDPTAAPDGAADLTAARDQIAALEEANRALQMEAGGLRYRRWLLARRLGDAIDAAQSERTLDVDALMAALAKDGEAPIPPEDEPNLFAGVDIVAPAIGASTPEPAPTAPIWPAMEPDAEAAATALRRRVDALESDAARLRRLTASDSAAGSEADAASLRHRLWVSQSEARRLTSELRVSKAAAGETPRADAEALRAALDDASRLRALLATAEAGLRETRAALAQRPTEADLAAAQKAELTAKTAAESARAATDSLKASLERNARSQVEAAQAETTAARAAEADLRAKLLSTERALAQRASESARLTELETELARLKTKDRVEPEVAAELETLRARLRRHEAAAEAAPSVESMRRREAEAEALRSRLALAQAEAERLKAELDGTSRDRRLSAAGAAFAALRSGAAMDAPPGAGQTEGATTAGLRAGRRAGGDRGRSAPLDAASKQAVQEQLADVLSAPRTGEEAAALELIDSGRVVAVHSNRPAGLLEGPTEGAPDDLPLISTATPKLAAEMNRFGLFYFSQIEAFGPFEMAWLDDRLSLGGRVVRDRWIGQARRLAAWRRDGYLPVDSAGRHTAPAGAFTPPQQPAPAAAPTDVTATAAATALDPAVLARAVRAETVDSLPPHDDSARVTAPLSGAEAAAREALERLAGSPALDENRPSGFAATALVEATDADALDDLTAIRGVGPMLQAALRSLGVGRYRQIALLAPEEAAWLDRRLGLGGRVVTDRWLPQAQHLAELTARRRRTAALAALSAPTPAASGPNAASAQGPAPTGAAPAPDLIEADRGIAPSEPISLSMPASMSASAPAPSLDPAPTALQTAPTAPVPIASAEVEAVSTTAADAEEVETAAAVLIEQGAATGAFEDRPASARQSPEDEGDDLTAIRGVGPKQDAQLKALGFHNFKQLAEFGPRDLAWLDAALGLRGRVVGEGWVRQARRLAERKERGELRLGPDGVWTLPDPNSDSEAALEAAMRAPLGPVEREAMRLLDSGGAGSAAARPTDLLRGPTGASPDPLQNLRGVSAGVEDLLNEIGIYYYSQIADFSAPELAWLDAKLNLNGRVVRDRWASQAAALERLKRTGVRVSN